MHWLIIRLGSFNIQTKRNRDKYTLANFGKLLSLWNKCTSRHFATVFVCLYKIISHIIKLKQRVLYVLRALVGDELKMYLWIGTISRTLYFMVMFLIISFNFSTKDQGKIKKIQQHMVRPLLWSLGYAYSYVRIKLLFRFQLTIFL